MVLLCTICFHLYFHPIVQNFRKNDSFASEHSSLSKPNNIGFFLKGYILITVYNFGVPEQHTVELGKDRARPTQTLIAPELSQDAHDRGCL